MGKLSPPFYINIRQFVVEFCLLDGCLHTVDGGYSDVYIREYADVDIQKKLVILSDSEESKNCALTPVHWRKDASLHSA